MTDTKPKFPTRFLLVVLALALAAGLLYLLPGADQSETEFVPPKGGYHTAWLVAGPYSAPVTDLEEQPLAREEAPFGTSKWRLETSAESMIKLATVPEGTKVEKQSLYYAAGTLLSKAGGKRNLLLSAFGKSRVRLNGKWLGNSSVNPELGTHEIEVDVQLEKGANPVLIETSTNAGNAMLFFCLRRRVEKGGEEGLFGAALEDAPETMSLAIKSRNSVEQRKLLAETLWLARDRFSVWGDPGDTITLKLVRGGSAPLPEESLTVTVTARPKGASSDTPLTSRTLEARQLLSSPLELKVTLPAGNFVQTECSAKVSDAVSGELLASRSVRFYSHRGIRSASLELETRARAIAGKLGLGMNKVALAMLKAEKCRLKLLGFGAGEGKARAALAELDAGEQALAAAGKGLDPLADQIGWIERAYWCGTDGSPQPYRLNVPRRMADPAQQQGGKIPLVVYLHGYVPSHNKHQWVEWNEISDLATLADKIDGAMLLAPFGRSNTDFVSIGEVDVLRAIRETCAKYPIDTDRIYLYGYSMGGYGAYALATHYPDMFAGVVVMAARPEPYYLEQQAMIGRPRARQPVYKGFCLDVDNPSELALNLRTLPTMIYHATRDGMVPIESTRKMVVDLKNMKSPVFYRELDGDHYACFEVMSDPAHMRTLLGLRRRKPTRSVRLRTYSPRYGRMHWARVAMLTTWTRPAGLFVSHDGQGHVSVEAINVREFTLKGIPAPKGLKLTGAKGYEINALQRNPEKQPNVWDIRARLRSAPREGRWRKNAKLPGPMKEACNTPFIVVYDRPAPKAAAGAAIDPDSSEAKAHRFAREWEIFAKGRPSVKCERDLTPAEKSGKSIILFCTPSKSKLLAEAAATLECLLSDTEFEIAGRKAALNAERGLVLTRPSPWAPGKDRYLVVCTGLFYGESAAENHKLDLVPDFIVFTPGKEGEGEPPAVLAGYFDSDWKASAKLVEVFKR
jgi:pimeloyl-ACP methyl ester carboxylesterase